MDPRDKWARDSDSPTMPGISAPKHNAAATQTPPPLSNEVTLPHPSPVPISVPPAFSGSPSSIAATSITAFLSLQPGVVFAGRYEILRVLGQGGMGAVYQARDRELDRMIALKVIRPELATDPAILARFKQELILARNITHKNVVRIYDLGESEGIRFITMEYVDGEDLRTILRSHGKFAADQAIPMIEQVCRALDSAHSEGVIHRDLKPQNIMRDKQGRIVVMDFGLARSLGDSGMTQTGAIVGTMEYMSPEQALGAQLDQRSDIFSVGLIFYELITGKSPYHADTAIASLMRRTREVAKPASDVENTVPRSLSAIVSRCLEREPANRYHSVVELLQQLNAWTANPNISSDALSKMISHPIIHPSRVNLDLPGKKWMWIAAAVMVVILAGVVGRTLLNKPGGTQGESIQGIPPLSQGKYVAVLPLKVVGDEKTLGYVADGIQEALIAKLFQLKEVRLASTSAVEAAASKDLSTTKLAREVGANLVLQGMVQGSGDKLRVTLKLDNAITGRTDWSEEFAGMPADLLTLEDQIYGNVVAGLSLKPSNEELAHSGAHPTENLKAYDLYLQGKNVLRNSHDVASVQPAIPLFEQAIEKDTNFGLAYAGLADASLRIYGENKDTIWAQKAIAAAQQADKLSSTAPEVHLALGAVYTATGRNSQAISELKRALELAPNSDSAYRLLGDAYTANGQNNDAIVAYKNAVAANPYYWVNHNSLGKAYLELGDSTKAVPEFQKVAELASDNPIGYENIGLTFLRTAQWTEAIPHFQKALAIAPSASTYSNLGTTYFFLKNYEESTKMFEKAVQMAPDNETYLGNLGDSYRQAGHSEKALAAYDKAISKAFQQLQVNPRAADTMGDVAVYYARKGDSRNSLQYIQQARTINPEDLQLMYWDAVVKTLVAKPEDALKSLRLALQKGYPAQEAWNDPELQKLQALPQFALMVKEFTPKTTKP